MRNYFLLLAALLTLPAHSRAADTAAALENRVQQIVAGPQVTVVHFWAPWCGNCAAEMRDGGWARFVAKNADVKVVFINVWHRGMDPSRKMSEAGLVESENLLLLNHPEPSSKSGARLEKFLALPITWIPTTWVFREGRLRYAFNYGEIRFEILQALVDDSKSPWKH